MKNIKIEVEEDEFFPFYFMNCNQKYIKKIEGLPHFTVIELPEDLVMEYNDFVGKVEELQEKIERLIEIKKGGK